MCFFNVFFLLKPYKMGFTNFYYTTFKITTEKFVDYFKFRTSFLRKTNFFISESELFFS